MKEHDQLLAELSKEGNLPKRLEYARKLAGYNQAELSRRVVGKKSGHATVINAWERGRSKPGGYLLKRACEILNITEDWLRVGKGEMRPVETLSTGKLDTTLGTIAPELQQVKVNGAGVVYPHPPADLDIFQRVRWLMDHAGVDRKVLGQRSNISIASLGFYSAGKGTKTRRAIPPNMAIRLSEGTGARVEWILEGKGKVWDKEDDVPVAPAVQQPEQMEYVPPRPYHAAPRVNGFINVSLVEAQLSDAITRRNDAAHEAEQWQSILNTLRTLA